MNIDQTVFIAEGARVMGNLEVGQKSSIWFNAVVRADSDSIRIGKYSNVQDNAVLHIGRGHPMTIGDYVTIGHGAIVHGCEIGNNVMIGMGAIVMNGCKIGDNSIIGAGAVVTENKVVPANSLLVGCPAVVKKSVSPEQAEETKANALHYAELAEEYQKQE